MYVCVQISTACILTSTTNYLYDLKNKNINEWSCITSEYQVLSAIQKHADEYANLNEITVETVEVLRFRKYWRVQRKKLAKKFPALRKVQYISFVYI